jgi:hypothetical protein
LPAFLADGRLVRVLLPHAPAGEIQPRPSEILGHDRDRQQHKQ